MECLDNMVTINCFMDRVNNQISGMFHLAIDRTRWQSLNILVISLIYNRRAIPLYFELLEKKGNSNLPEQTEALEKVISQLEKYKIVVLGEREFCVSLFSILA